jgi:hypothetical protein
LTQSYYSKDDGIIKYGCKNSSTFPACVYKKEALVWYLTYKEFHKLDIKNCSDYNIIIDECDQFINDYAVYFRKNEKKSNRQHCQIVSARELLSTFNHVVFLSGTLSNANMFKLKIQPDEHIVRILPDGA